MTQLVVGDELALFLGEHLGAPLETAVDPVDSLLDVAHVGDLLAVPGGEQCCLVDHVRELRAREPGGTPRENLEIDIAGEPHVARVDAENRLAPGYVGQVHLDLPVEAARAEQRRVEDLGAVRCGDEDDPAVGLEAVHLG